MANMNSAQPEYSHYPNVVRMLDMCDEWPVTDKQPKNFSAHRPNRSDAR